MAQGIAFTDISGPEPVRGFLHEAPHPADDSLVITHGAGGNCNAALLVALANLFSDAGTNVLRCDLPFRQARPKGSPSRTSAAHDQAGLRRAVELIRVRFPGRVFLGGQSYGGRQATMLAASDSSVCDGLLLLSYPLHPPGRATQMRTAHFPELRTPALFVTGTRDDFGTPEELTEAIKLIPARTQFVQIPGARHGLMDKKNASELPKTIVEAWCEFCKR